MYNHHHYVIRSTVRYLAVEIQISRLFLRQSLVPPNRMEYRFLPIPSFLLEWTHQTRQPLPRLRCLLEVDFSAQHSGSWRLRRFGKW